MTRRPWYVRLVRAIGRWVRDVAGDDYDRALPSYAERKQRATLTRSEP